MVSLQANLDYSLFGCLSVYASIWPIVLLIAIVAVYVFFKVRYLMRISDEQWKRVDKSKLVAWDDDEDRGRR